MKIKYSKLSSKEKNLLLQAFVLAIPAMKAWDFAWVHRNTAQKFFTKIRLKIAESSIKNYEKLKWEIELDESYIWWRRKWNRGRWAFNKHIVFWILERWWQVRVIPVWDVTANTLMKEIEENTEKWCVYYTDNFRSYASLSRFWKHLKIRHEYTFWKWKNHINWIEWFRSYAKKFLMKYNGVSKKNFLLYMKEIERRYNNRENKDLIREIKKLL